MFHRAVLRYVHWRRDGWNCRQEFTVTTPRHFWDAVYELCKGKVTLFAVSACGFDDLTLCEVNRELDAGRLNVGHVVRDDSAEDSPGDGTRRTFRGRHYEGNPPDVLYALTPNGPLRAVGLRNYVPSPIRSLAQRAGVQHHPTAPGEPRSLIRDWSAEQLADVTEKTITHLLDWWRYGECGPWRDTTPQLALSLFKRHYLSHRLLIHANEDARTLEREATHGPRQTVWYYGRIGRPGRLRKTDQPPPDPENYPSEPGPTYRVDVRSQYPFLMRQHCFPSVLMGTRGPSDPREVEDLLPLWGIIARVQLRTDVAEYPFRDNDLTTYPTGCFVTTLAGPELAQAYRERAVAAVYAYARYELKPTFRAFADFLWRRRCEYRAAGNDSGELWAKLFGNSFAGKLTQKPGRWKPRPDAPPRKRWGITHVKTAGSDVWHVERGIAGQREVWDKDAASQPVCPAAFAYLTAYSRLQMRALRELLHPRMVYGQHTDCLWVNEAGYEKLTAEGKIEPNELGGLRPSDPIQFLQFLGPSHRYADGRWTAGGIAEGFHVMRHCRFHVTMMFNTNRGKDVRLRTTVHEFNGVKTIAHVRRPHSIGPDGWAVPFYHAPPVGDNPTSPEAPTRQA